MNNVYQKTCIMCPMGCNLTITQTDKETIVTGNNCVRGAEYGKSEIVCPMRTLTTLVKTKKGVSSVKTSAPIPKTKINKAMKEIENTKVSSTQFGEVIIKNISDTNANVVVTKF